MAVSPETVVVGSGSALRANVSNANAAEKRRLTVVGPAQGADERLYLTGRPTLKQFLQFVRNQAVDPSSEGKLTEQWHAANRVVRSLEKEQAGAADAPPISRMQVNPLNERLLTEFLKDPLVRHGFDTVPTEVALVELDRLVVYQQQIDLTYVRLLERELGPSPSEEQIFRTCLLHHHSQPAVKWSRTHRNSCVFMSKSNDLRFLGAMNLRPRNVRDYAPPGNLAGVLGLAVGFGSNFLNAIRVQGRLILNNGSHRAYALRRIGVTHVPCVVQQVSSRAELDVVATSAVMDNPDYYLKHPRPPMLTDYFDPRLHQVIPVQRWLRQITVNFEVDEAYVPAL